MIMDLGSKLNGFDVILIFFLVLFMMEIQNHYSTHRRATEAGSLFRSGCFSFSFISNDRAPSTGFLISDKRLGCFRV